MHPVGGVHVREAHVEEAIRGRDAACERVLSDTFYSDHCRERETDATVVITMNVSVTNTISGIGGEKAVEVSEERGVGSAVVEQKAEAKVVGDHQLAVAVHPQHLRRR